jgi:hypothetical protein
VDGHVLIELEEGCVLDYHVPDLQFLAEGGCQGRDEPFWADEYPRALFLELGVVEEEVVVDGEGDLVVDQVVAVLLAEELDQLGGEGCA